VPTKRYVVFTIKELDEGWDCEQTISAPGYPLVTQVRSRFKSKQKALNLVKRFEEFLKIMGETQDTYEVKVRILEKL